MEDAITDSGAYKIRNRSINVRLSQPLQKLNRQLHTGIKLLGWITAAVAGVYAGYALYADEHNTMLASVHETPITQPIREEVFGPGALPATQLMREQMRTGLTRVFAVGPDGNLVINESTVISMQDALSPYPAKLTPTDQQRLEAEAIAGLPEKAAARALTLLRAYIHYQHAQAAFDDSEEYSRLPPQEVLDRTITLRRTYFDRDTALALFGAQEATARYDVEVIRVASDQSIGAEEKTERIQALRRALPPTADVGLLPSEISIEYEEQAARYRQRGAPDNELQELEEKYFGRQQ